MHCIDGKNRMVSDPCVGQILDQVGFLILHSHPKSTAIEGEKGPKGSSNLLCSEMSHDGYQANIRSSHSSKNLGDKKGWDRNRSTFCAQDGA